MNKLLKKYWISIAVWGLIIVATLTTMPNLSQLVRENDKEGQDAIGSSYKSSIAKNILKKYNNVSDGAKEVSLILVYNSNQKLTDQNMADIDSKVDNIENNKNKYGIITINNLFNNTELADELISTDGTTLLIPITLDKGTKTIDEIRSNIISVMKTDDLQLTSTGSDFVIEDFLTNTENGVNKTEIITIIFIFIIMLLIFRSPVTPFATLATVGLSYFVSLNIVLQLVNYLNFPLSNFTNVFLIIILFGIGTDYTLLLLMRYREELSNGVDSSTAIVNTYRSAGKTVLVSSITIIIGFACLYFVEFNLYRSASAVAIGIIIFILTLYTFLPAVMKLLGKYLFWSPVHAKGHAESKAWERVSRFSTRFPFVTLIISMSVCCLILFYNDDLSFDSIKEVSTSSPSVVGYNVIASHFSSGKTMPVTIAIESKNEMDNQSDLADLDSLTESIKTVNGVDMVYSVTQPKGRKLDGLYLDSQLNTVTNGVSSAKSGILEIKNGLQSAISQLEASSSDTGSLIQLKEGISSLVSGLDTAKDSSNHISLGITTLKVGSSSLSSNFEKLEASCNQLGNGLSTSVDVSSQITQGIQEVNSNLSSMGTMLATMSSDYDELKTGLTGVGTNLSEVGSNLTSVGTNTNDIATNTQAISQQLAPSGDVTVLSELNNIVVDTQAIGTSLNTVNNDLTQVQQILTGLSGLDESGNLLQAQTGLNTMSTALT